MIVFYIEMIVSHKDRTMVEQKTEKCFYFSEIMIFFFNGMSNRKVKNRKLVLLFLCLGLLERAGSKQPGNILKSGGKLFTM